MEKKPGSNFVSGSGDGHTIKIIARSESSAWCIAIRRPKMLSVKEGVPGAWQVGCAVDVVGTGWEGKIFGTLV